MPGTVRRISNVIHETCDQRALSYSPAKCDNSEGLRKLTPRENHAAAISASWEYCTPAYAGKITGSPACDKLEAQRQLASTCQQSAAVTSDATSSD